MHQSSITKQLTLTALTPHQMAERLVTFQRALRARSGMLVEVRWHGLTRSDAYEANVTYQLPC